MELICANDERDSGDKFTSPEFYLPFTKPQTDLFPNVNACLVNNLGKGGTQDACSLYKFPQGFISFRLFTAISTAANRPFRRNLFEKWAAP